MPAGPSSPSQPEAARFVLDLTTCDREPIHIPGAIQEHGILFALTGPDLTVTAVSANVAQHLGAEPSALLGLPIADLVDAASAGALGESDERSSALRLRLNASPDSPWRAAVHRSADRTLLEADLPRPHPDLGSGDMFERYDRATRRLRTAADIPTVCQRLAEEIHSLTGFDRVKVYRFARDWSGEVIAEASNNTLPSYLGLHFPATDIPVQARELYRRNLERLIPDIGYTPVPLIQATPDPIDLSDVSLRSVSPIHIEYLQNMRVGASMSLSILRDGALWGLVACHHGTAHYLWPEIRQAGMLLAQLVSWQLALVDETETLRLGGRAKTIETEILQETTAGHDYRECLLRHGGDLLALLGAGGLALGGGGKPTTLGVTPEGEALDDLMAWLAQRTPGLLETDHLAAIYPPARDLPVAAGLLAVPLGGTADNLMVWFRPEIARTVTWGGDPSKPVESDSMTDRLNPRLSFAGWKETVRGRSRPWESPEIAAAQSLRDTVAEIIVRRSLLLEEMNRKLIRTNEELESFAYIASHDLKEPLRQIETFGTMLERVFDNRAPPGADPKLWFEGIQSASRRLRMLIDDLAQFSRLGRHANPFAPCDLNAVLAEVRTDLGFQIAATRANVLSEHLPNIICDHTQMRQIVQNLVSNAIKYHHPDRPPEIRIAATIRPGDNQFTHLPMLELAVSDNGIGFEQRHHDRIFEPFQRLHSADVYEGSGIGLAICRKIVDRHGGSISATSSPGEGSVFVVKLPLRPLPNGE